MITNSWKFVIIFGYVKSAWWHDIAKRRIERGGVIKSFSRVLCMHTPHYTMVNYYNIHIYYSTFISICIHAFHFACVRACIFVDGTPGYSWTINLFINCCGLKGNWIYHPSLLSANVIFIRIPFDELVIWIFFTTLFSNYFRVRQKPSTQEHSAFPSPLFMVLRKTKRRETEKKMVFRTFVALRSGRKGDNLKKNCELNEFIMQHLQFHSRIDEKVISFFLRIHFACWQVLTFSLSWNVWGRTWWVKS